MDNLLFLIIMVPVSALFTGLGIYAFRRKKPIWFWSGSTVSEKDISDVPAYNRANGIMWIAFSAIFWTGTVLGLLDRKAAGMFIIAGCIVGVPALPIIYGKIYEKYRVRK